MNIFQKILAFLIFVVALGIILYVFAINLMKSSLPTNTHKILKVANVQDTIQIYRNDFWFPQIIAKNEADLYYAIGYCHALDRLWQMDFTLRAVKGRLSEIFGEETFEIDLFIKSLDIENIARQNLQKASEKTKFILESYCKGINDYIENNRKNLSFEFSALGYTPEQWTPIDCLCLGKGVALELSIPLWTEITLGEIASKIGADRANDLIAKWNPNDPYVLTDSIIQAPEKRHFRKTSQFKYDTTLFKYLSERIEIIREFLGITASSIGSNSWAVSKLRSPKSSSILANDPHLSLGLPPKWYPLQITAPGINVIGLTIPGIPLPIIGRNQNIAWGITNIMIDDCDFYIELIDSLDENYYFDSKRQRQKFQFIVDTIKIKNKEPFIYYKRKTHRSYVISDFHIFNKPDKIVELDESSNTNSYLKNTCITFNWTLNNINDELLALYRINKAQNWNEFKKGLELWGSPGQNFTYIDKKGNVGIIPAGVIPIRDINCNPNIPNPGWLENTDWLGYYNPNYLGYKYNPNTKFVYSANNHTSAKISSHISSYFEPSSRAKRIKELLEQINNYSIRDAKIMQYDLYSHYAFEMMSYCLEPLNASQKIMNPLELEALDILNKWDYFIGEKSPAASIFNAFLERLIYETFADELGERLYRQYVMVSNVPLRKILEIIADPHNEWFDDINTNENEFRNYIIFKSFRSAIENLKQRFGNEEIKTWHWSKIHQLTLEHPFSRSSFLKHTVTLGPIELGGNITTLNNTEWRIYKPYEIVLGASARFIADMDNDIVYINLPGGISGDPLSNHYSDQLQIWARGGYVTIYYDFEKNSKFSLNLTLMPK